MTHENTSAYLAEKAGIAPGFFKCVRILPTRDMAPFLKRFVSIMKLGMSHTDENSSLYKRRIVASKLPGMDSLKYHTDMTHILLLGALLIAGLIGHHIIKRANQPVNILKTSIDKSLGQSFRASLEGSITLKDSTVSVFRNHQIYSEHEGLSIIEDEGYSESTPFDAVNSIEILRGAQNIMERNKEDMYGHATRHFRGTLPDGNPKSTALVFDYWIDMTNLLAVRLIIAQVERDMFTDTEGNSHSRETFINIRYHSWRLPGTAGME